MRVGQGGEQKLLENQSALVVHCRRNRPSYFMLISNSHAAGRRVAILYNAEFI